ncbi:MAG TPA: histidine phosphatase family protein, partial [Hyphomonadaceae bacterium]|nr:histidine phosphatase family protein [Hyphomonadaceae bacterium]
IASPLGRAQHTARLIREAGEFTAEIETDARIAELQLGEWDGKLKLDIAQSSPDFDAGRRRWSWYFDAPGGTSFEGISTRISSWLDDARKFEAPTIVVSHGIASRVLRGLFLGLSREETLMQDIPQDACFHLSDGKMRRIDCA